MNSIEKAKNILKDDLTIAVVAGNKTYTSTFNGIRPMLDFIEQGLDLKGAYVCDRVVGKAVAMLFAYAKVKAVHAIVISRPALDFLNEQNIIVSYDTLVDNIKNRSNTGLCPMEQTVADLTNPFVALTKLKEKVKEMRSVGENMNKQ